MAAIPNQTRIQHLYLRAGFGAKASRIQSEVTTPVKTLVKALLKESKDYTPIQLEEENLVSHKKPGTALRGEKDDRQQEMKMLVQESQMQIRALNARWIERMAQGPDMLRQKMTLFWHGHFACRPHNALSAQQYLNTLQQHALGNFGDLLRSICQTPAMLQFLHDGRNRKNSSHENFAQPLMALFTLGRGNYTESDVKNAAKAFTGWGLTPEGHFIFRQEQHDESPKTIFGQTGSFTGDEVLNLILKKKETALFVCRKIYRYFVNDQEDAKWVQAMADRFYKSGYNIKDLMEYVFTADWFYDPAQVGSRIKSPMELIAGLSRTLDIQFEDQESLIYIQKMLGQVALYPPNVAGWPEGRSWIDNSSLLFRMQLPEVLFKTSDLTMETKYEGDAETEYLSKRGSRQMHAKMNRTEYLQAFAGYPDAALPNQLAAYLLQIPLTDALNNIIVKRAASSANREDRINNLTLSILTLPEYQLC
jgi:uncharacterized protein (DUF1800 family)